MCETCDTALLRLAEETMRRELAEARIPELEGQRDAAVASLGALKLEVEQLKKARLEDVNIYAATMKAHTEHSMGNRDKLRKLLEAWDK